ncbi:RNA-binding protein 12B-like [Scomber scombrus]|uniref:RNA-binding protein 12B-like n=1 Tax=Scomber scombrus TaxID=13677 RepID=A0AAV1NMU5_SCOSC|nr:RNA-binding protein 12B-like [Scomber scombrus]
MAIVLRLQGLNVTAGIEDIRKFFEYLHIPDGGVYILGGSLREAFIAFNTERDAQLAMRHTGSLLKGSKVTLYISSMTELEQKLKLLLKGKKPSPTRLIVRRPQPSPEQTFNTDLKVKKPSPTRLIVKSPQPSPEENLLPLNGWPLDPNSASLSSFTAAPPTSAASHGPSTANLQTSSVGSFDSNAAFLLGVCTVLKSLQSLNEGENNEAEPRVDPRLADTTVVASNKVRQSEQTQTSRPGYVRLFGLPVSVTKEDICHFFRGLNVQETIVNVMLGLNHGCLVKFANMQDAHEALFFNQQSLGSSCVEVRGATEKMWTSALQECETVFDVEKRVKPKQNPLSESANHRHLISTLQNKRRYVNRFPASSKSPKKPRTDCDSSIPMSVTMEYIVMVRNIPKNMTKTEIKELFGCPNMLHKNVLHLLDREGNRTDIAFIIFNHTEDYDYAMNLNGCHVGHDAIEVSSITREKMRAMVAKTYSRSLNQRLKMGVKRKPFGKRKSNSVETPGGTPGTNLVPAAQTCLFVRNLPADVHKGHIKMLFREYKLRNGNIILLHDSDGKGIGEAVVQFKSQKLAAMAQELHSQDFRGSKVLLTPINVKQMKDILARSV